MRPNPVKTPLGLHNIDLYTTFFIDTMVKNLTSVWKIVEFIQDYKFIYHINSENY